MAVDINWSPKHNWRLRWHLQTPTGGLTDPNGLMQFKGIYHFFHQYTPRWPADGHGWGHWTSPDLVDWTFHGSAISPDCELDRNGSYSGSGLVRNGEMWCYYTGNVLEPGNFDYDYAGRLANETLVTSPDGMHFSSKRLVLGNDGYPAYCSNHVRDPKVWEQDGEMHMLLGARTNDDRGCVLLYRSVDGLSWEFDGSCTSAAEKPFGYMWECPNAVNIGGRSFLFVCPQGVPKQPFKFQNIHNSGYFPLEEDLLDLMRGDEQGMDAEAPHACVDEKSFVELDYGFDFYAPQVFTDERGRTILVGWVSLPDVEMQYELPTREWLGTLTAPRELSLNAAGTVCQWPVEEIDGLRQAPVELTAEGAVGATGTVGSSSYDMFDVSGAIGACFPNGTADVVVRGIEGEGRIMIGSDLELAVLRDMLELDFQGPSGRWRTVRRLPFSALSAGRVNDLRIMVDTSTVEIYVNGGERTMTTRWYPLDITDLHVTSTLAAEHQAWELGAYAFHNVG